MIVHGWYIYIQAKFYLVVVGLRVVENPGGRIPGLLGGAGGWGRGGRSDIWEVVGGPTGGLVGLKKKYWKSALPWFYLLFYLIIKKIKIFK